MRVEHLGCPRELIGEARREALADRRLLVQARLGEGELERPENDRDKGKHDRRRDETEGRAPPSPGAGPPRSLGAQRGQEERGEQEHAGRRLLLQHPEAPHQEAADESGQRPESRSSGRSSASIAATSRTAPSDMHPTRSSSCGPQRAMSISSDGAVIAAIGTPATSSHRRSSQRPRDGCGATTRAVRSVTPRISTANRMSPQSCVPTNDSGAPSVCHWSAFQTMKPGR